MNKMRIINDMREEFSSTETGAHRIIQLFMGSEKDRFTYEQILNNTGRYVIKENIKTFSQKLNGYMVLLTYLDKEIDGLDDPSYM